MSGHYDSELVFCQKIMNSNDMTQIIQVFLTSTSRLHLNGSIFLQARYLSLHQ